MPYRVPNLKTQKTYLGFSEILQKKSHKNFLSKAACLFIVQEVEIETASI
jgi:hypothetical protein